jgi:tetratricopeptide (TPR) repeat protein
MKQDKFRELIEFLTPIMNPAERSAIVNMALFGESLRDSVDWSGNNRKFTVDLIVLLDNHHAHDAIAAILDEVATLVGTNQQTTITRLKGYLSYPRDIAGVQNTKPPTQMTAQDYFARAQSRTLHDFEGRIADYSDALRLKPDFAEVYARRGYNYYVKEELDLALRDFADAIRLAPDSTLGYTNRSLVLEARGEYQQALYDANKCIELEPTNAYFLYRRAIIYSKLQRDDACIADLHATLRINPDYVDGLRYLAAVQTDNGRYIEAIQHATRVLQLSEDTDHLLRSMLGELSFKTSQYTVAVSHLTRAIQLHNPAAPQFNDYYYRGMAYAAQNMVQLALGDWHTMLKHGVQQDYIHGAAIIADLGQIPAAIALLSVPLYYKISVNEALYLRGSLFVTINEYQHGITDLNQVNPDPSQAFYVHKYLGIAYENTNDIERAKHHYTKAKELKPHDSDVQGALGRLTNQGGFGKLFKR